MLNPLSEMKSKRLHAIFLVLLFSLKLTGQNYQPVTYAGNKDDHKDFIENEMQYPEQALKNKIQGDVELSFIVLPNGKIKDIEIDKSVNKEINAEAIRLTKMMQWEPAKKYGKAVGSRHSIKIPFHVRKYKKACKRRGFTENPVFEYPIDSSWQIFKKHHLDYPPEPILPNKGQRLNDFIIESMKYPEIAFRQSISGTVVLEFIVETNGKTSHYRIIESVGGGCNEEAKRIARLINWKPGTKNKKMVRSIMQMKVTFELPDQSEMDYFYNSQNTAF